MNTSIVNDHGCSCRVPVRKNVRAAISRTLALSSKSSSSVRTDVRAVDGLSKVLQQKPYRAVLLDQFGCLHDGRQPYEGVIDCVREIHAAGIPIWIISNSSRRATGTIDALERKGFKAEWFAGAVTSGELAFEHLQNRPTDWWRHLGRRVLHLTWGSRGLISLEGLNLEVVDWPEEAEFILAHGSEAVGSAWGRPVREMSLPKINQLLVRAAAISKINRRPMPMIVANPDLVTVDGDNLVVMPGTLAATYQELGGMVQLMGKPAHVIYDHSLKGLGMEDKPGEVLAIGDSIQHDIAGAAALGIDTLLVAGGIHASQLLTDPSSPGKGINNQGLGELCEQHRTHPTYITTMLKW